jgi:phosphoribosylanthranilate isomerase
MTWVKICGTTSLHDAQLSVAAGTNALGFIFAPSPRQVEVALAAEVVAALPDGLEKIGVFVNESPERVAEIVAQVGLTGAQLHGDEPAEQLQDFRKALGNRKIIKALQARELLSASQETATKYLRSPGGIDAVLLDSGSSNQRGGTGVPFAWKEAAAVTAKIQGAVPLIIAGGLNAHNVGDALRLFHPWGVDVVSGVEREPGRKDETKLRDFVAAVRREEAGVR